jgi:ADP-ribosylglycohydrolase
MQKNRFKDVLLGVSVGDALGVPFEFESRDQLKANRVNSMTGYGTHNVPAGTWSDDSSLTFCLAEALLLDFNLQNVANNFIGWLYKGVWTPYGKVFDIGVTTDQAICNLKNGVSPECSGMSNVESNGNGSLMRILPLVFYIKNKPIKDRFEITRKVSAITHGHIRAVVACFYYLEFARLLLQDVDKFQVYNVLKNHIVKFLRTISVSESEIAVYARLLTSDIFYAGESEIYSDGYVVNTLEASIWCILTTNNYAEAVLKAVNLGDDTDTTAAITGGLAGLLYGYNNIPQEWLLTLARRDDIVLLAESLELRFG